MFAAAAVPTKHLLHYVHFLRYSGARIGTRTLALLRRKDRQRLRDFTANGLSLNMAGIGTQKAFIDRLLSRFGYDQEQRIYLLSTTHLLSTSCGIKGSNSCRYPVRHSAVSMKTNTSKYMNGKRFMNEMIGRNLIELEKMKMVVIVQWAHCWAHFSCWAHC